MSRSRALVAFALALGVLAVSGCVGEQRQDDALARDDVILHAIATLDGVDSSDVEFDNSFGNGSRYEGDVVVAPDADARCVLVQTLGLLQQGRPGVALSSVTVIQGATALTVDDLTPEQQSSLQATAASPGGAPVVPGC